MDKKKEDFLKVFLIAPFDASSSRLQDSITRNLEKVGIRVLRLDKVVEIGDRITDNIITALELADIVIVDVSRQNPNVMYELGYAHALRKPTLIIADKSEMDKLPIDLRGYFIQLYDKSNFTDFNERLLRSISVIVEHSGRSK